MTFYILTRGGFGNVLFNYLLGYSIAKKYKAKVVYINCLDPKRPQMKSYSIFANEIIINKAPPNCAKLVERLFTFDPIVIKDLQQDIIIDGYFQSFKYSEEYIDEIRTNLFSKLNEISDYITHANKTTIMLHVRRGDYLNLQHIHPIQSDQYYKTCIEHIISKVGHLNIKLLVFSDDINFVSKWDVIKNYNHEIITLKDVEETFNLMRQCDHFIVSNSSFSLLAYYLRDKKEALICMPRNWFGEKGPKFNLDDLVEKSPNRFIYP